LFNSVSLGAETLADHFSEVCHDINQRQCGCVSVATRDVMQSLFQLLKDQCQAVGHILSDVLSLQKIEEGQFTLDMAPFSPAQLVLNSVRSAEPMFKSKHQKITVHIADRRGETCNSSLSICPVGDEVKTPGASQAVALVGRDGSESLELTNTGQTALTLVGGTSAVHMHCSIP